MTRRHQEDRWPPELRWSPNVIEFHWTPDTEGEDRMRMDDAPQDDLTDMIEREADAEMYGSELPLWVRLLLLFAGIAATIVTGMVAFG